ncbi:hypothetical protein DPMN_134060 [Dreissena polymorpha]|uniref:EGF-like domain-containing protein n=1 Tax=Dreissena polymorpha TaxID=45954 RepID=A0A9D4FZ67_DREPO|nr:hypothetical protein DPMN_134060 [Dreissena polymorpha]
MSGIVYVLAFVLFNCPMATASTTGKEFVTGFLSYAGENIFKIDIASQTSAEVLVYVPYLQINRTWVFNKTLSFALDSSIALFGTRMGQHGVFIKSNVDITVYVTTSYSPGADTYVSIPIESLSNKYQIASYAPNYISSYPSVFMVIAAFDDTSINVSFPNGTTISKSLNWLDIYQEASSTSDLTGTFVQSSKPVSVISGASLSYVVTHTSGYYDMLVEQVIPLNAFESLFIVPPIYNSKQFIVRIFSSQSTNRVCVKDASFEDCTMVGSTKWIESAAKRTPLIVTSQEPISVVQYKESDSYMTIIPGIRQFMNSYAFVVPEVYNGYLYVALTVLTSAIHTLRLDGRSPADAIIDKANVPAPWNEYTVLTCMITLGYHVITSNETSVTFGVLVYGYIDSGRAFAFPAGMLLHLDECASFQCHNGGTCSDGVNRYTCTCAAGFSGKNCQTNIDECASSPCLHGGTCSDGVNAYNCTCPAGFSGWKCENNLDECASSPCQHGGTCSDGVNRYSCTCSAGFSGKNCQTNIDECASSPCLHSGTCSDGVNAFTCACPAGFSGLKCETNLDECASSPCQHGGTCSDGVNRYTCTCSAGFSGMNCQTNIDECASSPCLHSGTCSDGVNAFTCACPAGFSGLKCETNLDECASSPCQHGGTCSDGVNRYTCTCSAGFSGMNCQISKQDFFTCLNTQHFTK